MYSAQSQEDGQNDRELFWYQGHSQDDGLRRYFASVRAVATKQLAGRPKTPTLYRAARGYQRGRWPLPDSGSDRTGNLLDGVGCLLNAG